MTVVVTRPTDTLAAGGSVTDPSGFGNDEALADNLDTTFVILTHGDNPIWQFANPVIPSGGVVKEVRLRARRRRPGEESLLVDWAINDGSRVLGLTRNVAVSSKIVSTVTVCGDLTAGQVHVTPSDIEVSIYAHSAGGGQEGVANLYALYFDTIYVAKPVVNITAPTGTITGDTTPTVSWTNTTLDTDGGPQKFFQAKTSTSSSPGAAAIEDSGEVESGANSWTPTTAISDGTRYAHVRTAQVVNGVKHWSDYDTQSFTVSIARPGVPTMTLTAQSSSGRIQVALDDNAGAATTDLFQTQVSNDGTTWVDLRTDEGDGLSTPAAGLATEYDYEGANGATRHFRTRALHDYGSSGFAVSAWSSTATSSWTSTDWWVKNLLAPSLNVTVLPRSQPSTTRTGRVGLFQPLDAKYPIAVLDKRSSASGQLVFRFDSDTARDAFEALCDEASVVLIQAPTTVQDWPDRYCALGDYERERVIDSPGNVYTFDSVSWTEVARPVP